ncbi:tRNA (uridine(54)-C5)-methyltransferase TrmA [uncultured Campylobacter sp.]|uniref:tRNA (uridine(54)-C5)-methyltransferase TrmA n=1 Tax=uncultured Campylobacter sp. TaxID=218934 RepID=UPI00260B3535|nr:tRNA (uridine(54)-C5)-methyltransferase TrmA [uncultured Campylobacter sp.]
MNCESFGSCGSCTLGGSYEDQILYKKQLIADKFREFFDGEFEFFASSPQNYRIKAEFGIWHDIWHSAFDLAYTMGGARSKKILINECPKVALPIANLMPQLLEALRRSEALKEKLFGVEFISCASGILATLLYHKRLGEREQEAICELADKLGIRVMARARGQKLLSGELSLTDELYVDGRVYKFRFGENAFIQPNRSVNEKMIAWARSCVDFGKEGTSKVCAAQNSAAKNFTEKNFASQNSAAQNYGCEQSAPQNSSCEKHSVRPESSAARDLLELYCGHGNFTIPLAAKFNRVLASEISKSSIANARINCELNGVCNAQFVRLSADELMSAFARRREFERLKGIDIFSYDFSHVLIDPPRAGLEPSVIDFIKNFQNLIYISCNPQTLFENLRSLCTTHEVRRFAIFDQFAHTAHIECGVLLKRRS